MSDFTLGCLFLITWLLMLIIGVVTKKEAED